MAPTIARVADSPYNEALASLRCAEFMRTPVGTLLPYVFVGLVQITIILGPGCLVFDVTLQRDLADLAAIMLTVATLRFRKTLD